MRARDCGNVLPLAGLDDIRKKLRPEDRLSLIAVGSSTRALWHRAMKCSAANLERAHEFAAQLDADLGGPELQKALNEAYAIRVVRCLEDVAGTALSDAARAAFTQLQQFAVQSDAAITEPRVREALDEALE